MWEFHHVPRYKIEITTSAPALVAAAVGRRPMTARCYCAARRFRSRAMFRPVSSASVQHSQRTTDELSSDARPSFPGGTLSDSGSVRLDARPPRRPKHGSTARGLRGARTCCLHCGRALFQPRRSSVCSASPLRAVAATIAIRFPPATCLLRARAFRAYAISYHRLRLPSTSFEFMRSGHLSARHADCMRDS